MNQVEHSRAHRFLSQHSNPKKICSLITGNTRSPAVARVGQTVLVVTELEGHPMSMIFISSEKAYVTFH